jgi:hypothetical protein
MLPMVRWTLDQGRIESLGSPKYDDQKSSSGEYRKACVDRSAASAYFQPSCSGMSRGYSVRCRSPDEVTGRFKPPLWGSGRASKAFKRRARAPVGSPADQIKETIRWFART